MALAILKFLSIDEAQVKFKIDTGTNSYFYLKTGESVSERSGIKWVDGETVKTALKVNERSATLLNTNKNIVVPLDLFSNKKCYVQLFSFKDPKGRSPAFSSVIKVPLSLTTGESEFSLSTSSTSSITTKMANVFLNPHRLIPHVAADSVFSKQASFEDILSGIARMAGPIVMGLLTGLQNGTASGGAATAPAVPQMGMLNTILDSLLNGLLNRGNPAPATIAPSTAVPVGTTPAATTAVSTTPSAPASGSRPAPLTQSFSTNRFLNVPSQNNLSRPFIFGIDDALIASLVGPILQVLPQLTTAHNQAKLQTRVANNQLISNLVGDVNRRMMLQQFLENQSAQGQPAPAGLPPGVDIAQLLQLLQQTAPATAAQPTPAPVVPTQSLSVQKYATLSTTTILSFEATDSKIFCGKDTIVYQKNAAIKLKIKLNVSGAVPKNPLPKAIIKFVFRDDNGKTLFEKIFKEKNIMPNAGIEFAFAPPELNHLPVNTPILIIAEMKWLTANGKEVKTLGSTEIVFAENYFLKELANEVQSEKELTDMKLYRSFWNKIWESPLLDKVNTTNEGYKKFMWEIETNLKYAVVLSCDAPNNGLMATKLLKAENELESLSEKTEGRIKGGIELSIAELNKMCVLWNGQAPLTNDKLAALKTKYFITKNASEFTYKIKLKGKEHERGLFWIVPTLQLNSIILNKITAVNDYGQVTATTEETILFPLPKSARILGLKTT